MVKFREVNVPIYTVGVGAEIDEMTLTRVANGAGGASLITPQPEELKAAMYSVREVPGDATPDMPVAAYITTLVMNYLFTGKFKRTK